ncbi:MAG: hypothetical protein K2Q23_00635 [Bryobacteraceae bacterium]|nr:hypothetical protein [Bryobacteraceae bacterium]
MRSSLAFGLLGAAMIAAGQTAETYEEFRFTAPRGWVVEKGAQYLALKKDNGRQYVNSYVFRPRPSSGSHSADFDFDWKTNGAKYGLAKPEKVNTVTQDGWQITTGAGNARLSGQPFVIFVITRTGPGVAYSIVHYFNEESFAPDVAAFTSSVVFTARPSSPAPPAAPATRGGPMRMTKATTNFNDGWVATPEAEYVRVTKAGTEVRLYYVNLPLEEIRGQTMDPADFYWSRIVAPGIRTVSAQKYVGVNYPPIYFVEAGTPDGRHVAMKVIYAGGPRVVVAIAPNRNAYAQQFGHPNDLDRMLSYNRFGVTAPDLVGVWSKSGGGGVEHYNAYTGTYAGMSAISTTDDFQFNTDGTYSSQHRSANTSNGSTRFGGQDFQGRFTVSDWEVHASNRVEGKTKKFWARLEAIQNGYLLILTDSDYEPLQYILFRRR